MNDCEVAACIKALVIQLCENSNNPEFIAQYLAWCSDAFYEANKERELKD
jgi:hypothetical protein